MFPEKIYQLALTQTDHIGNVQAKLLVEQFKTATAIYTATKRELEHIPCSRDSSVVVDWVPAFAGMTTEWVWSSAIKKPSTYFAECPYRR